MPCLYVNGERYDFSDDVIQKGNILYQGFLELQKTLKKVFMNNNYEGNTEFEKKDAEELESKMETFDVAWANYENLYVKELMVIEYEARKYITDAICIEKRLGKHEKEAKRDDSVIKCANQSIDDCKKEFCKQIGKINSIANVEGHGRDDLDFSILKAADDILKQISSTESESIRKLAKNVKSSFDSIRSLLIKFDDNIEIVDPQLRNNQDLVTELVKYERFWEKGKIYFLNKKICDQLIYFSTVLEGLSEKYSDFKEKIEDYDAEVFVIIPMIMILRRIENEDKGICERFLPQLSDKTSNLYNEFKKLKEMLFDINDKVIRRSEPKTENFKRKSFIGSYRKSGVSTFKTLLKSQKVLKNNSTTKGKLSMKLYNTIEKIVIDDLNLKKCLESNGLENEKDEVESCLKILRSLSMELQRNNPTEWNEFLDISLDN